MTDADRLNVWYEDRLVGNLWRNPAGAIGFRYETNWIDSGGFPISCSLPLALDGISSADSPAHRFFANLLPEGGAREQLVRDLKIPNTGFDLLRAIGGECAGALTILPAERTPTNDGSYTILGEGELSQLVARRGRILSNMPNQAHPRLSLAGAQNKCPVLFRDGEYLLPKEAAPTSHILKFEVQDYRHVPAYERFTTQLAQQIGLPVVDIDLKSTGKRFYTRIERYDRVWDSSLHKLKRLHQEDFCQALGYGHERKYQDDGGPAFSQCLALLREVSSDPAIDVGYLLRWQVFNVLAGNSDGHAKNLSLLYSPGQGTRLAPFYDLICTRAMERVDHRLAFVVGGQREPGLIDRNHWKTMAEECDTGSRFLHGLVEETAAALLDRIGPARAQFEERYGNYPALQRIERVVKRQCRRVIRS